MFLLTLSLSLSKKEKEKSWTQQNVVTKYNPWLLPFGDYANVSSSFYCVTNYLNMHGLTW